MFRRAMMTIVAVMVAACGSIQESRRSEETLIEWNNQGDQEHLDSVLAECEAVTGMDITPGAHIIFMDDVSSVCEEDKLGLGEIVGCYISNLDMIFLEPRKWLGNTPICHELYHRELFIRIFLKDPSHSLPVWDKILIMQRDWITNHCELIDGTTICD